VRSDAGEQECDLQGDPVPVSLSVDKGETEDFITGLRFLSEAARLLRAQ
jgi:hypothetical protein